MRLPQCGADRRGGNELNHKETGSVGVWYVWDVSMMCVCMYSMDGICIQDICMVCVFSVSMVCVHVWCVSCVCLGRVCVCV